MEGKEEPKNMASKFYTDLFTLEPESAGVGGGGGGSLEDTSHQSRRSFDKD